MAQMMMVLWHSQAEAKPFKVTAAPGTAGAPEESSHNDKWGFPKSRGTFLGVPIIGIGVYWGLYWGPFILGNYRVRFWFKDSAWTKI